MSHQRSILTFPTKVPSDSLGRIGSLKRTSDKSLFPMALGSCGHRITHQLRPINMNGRSILAVTSILPRQESFASLHILTRRASEGSEALPSLARRVRMSFFGARVIAAVAVARCSWLALLDRWLETRVHITWPNNTLSHLRTAENVRPALRVASVQLNMTRGGFAITK